MALLVLAVGVVMLAFAVAVFVAPRRFVDWIAALGRGGFLGLAVGLRLFMAASLWLGAPECRHPTAVRILAGLALLGAFVGLAIGADRLRAMVDWWAAFPVRVMRSWGVVAGGLGAFLIHTSR